MSNVNNRRKLSFSFSVFLVVLLSIVSITYGTISSSANTNNLQTQKEKSSLTDLYVGKVFTNLTGNNQVDFLTNNLATFLNGNDNGQTAGINSIEANSNIDISAPSATFIVTRSDDRNVACNSGVDCSLLEAVNAANATTANDTINFASGLTTLTLV
ncbi:MAG: hypothetical protein ABR566_05850, partial [Pyrinomonadaceae bacterium]